MIICWPFLDTDLRTIALMSAYFESLTLFGCPPIGHRHFMFSSGLNILTGGNGTGKTSLAQTLRTGVWPYGGGVQLVEKTVSTALNQHWNISHIDINTPSFLDERPMDHWTYHCIGKSKLLRKVGALLSEMVSKKLGVQVTKFHSIPFAGEETFEVEVLPNGWVEVHAGSALKAIEHYSPYGSVEELFDAAGERFLIALAGILTVRDDLQITSPLIFDNAIGYLDQEFLGMAIEQIRRLNCQVFILEGPYDIERMQELGLFHPNEKIHEIDVPTAK